MLMKNKINLQFILMVLLCLLIFCKGNAQINNFGTGYFQNQYVFNPAMSGLEAKKGNIGAGFRKSGDVKNGPQSAYLNGDYAFNEKTGAGVNLFYDRAGLINTLKVMATYSYHVQLDAAGAKKLHFGLSVGGIQKRLNNGDVHGDLDDPSLYNFNDQFMHFEADFGMAYTDDKLTIQAAAPNLVSTFGKNKNNITDVADRQIYFAAVSYKIRPTDNEDGLVIEPKVAYRGIKHSNSILDAGANFSFKKELVNVFGLYHSNKSLSAGAGLRISNIVQATFLYNTQSSDFKAYSTGNYEIGLRFKLD
jgi:type IX secretion system PorP/SprF family membrane protein